MVYDRERLSWVGPWSFDANITHLYYDSGNVENLLMGSNSNGMVSRIHSSFKTDDGVAIPTVLKTKKTDFGDWSLFKTIRDIYSSWRNVFGDISVTIRLEDREGQTLSAKSFSLDVAESSAGFGGDMWGSIMWGDTAEDGTIINTAELVRWIVLNATARRMQITIQTNKVSDNYELLSLRTQAKPIGRGMQGSTWRV